jgi:VacB/RNase II family 3'-5' exoribonuclease
MSAHAARLIRQAPERQGNELWFILPPLMSKNTSHSNSFDLFRIAHQTMIEAGFVPDFPRAVAEEVRSITTGTPAVNAERAAQDLRELLWSSIDDKRSRDLDQVEYAEKMKGGDVRLLIGIADVDAFVAKASAIDKHAATNCTSVYTGVKTFPMLPEELSTDLTSLVEGEDRLAVVTEMFFAPDGSVKKTNFSRALIRNHAKLSYESIGAWLDGKASMPERVQSVPGLETQIKLQSEIANRLEEFRKKHGAIDLETIQTMPVVDARGTVLDLAVIELNSARDLIANFMITANVAMAEFLESKGGPSLRRVVRTPKYWSRIVEIAAELGEDLPASPDSHALADFLARRKGADPVHFPDLSLAVVKSLGPGEYTVQRPGDEDEGHFGLAVQDYTHSTAPNRRFADMVTQRLVKAALAGEPTPYEVAELKQIAEHCTERDSAERKVERKMRKVAAAILLHDKIGDEFTAIVTGVTPKGTFARTLTPPVDGRIVRGERGLRVGEKVRVRLLSTEPERGFIDFARA